ncbi:hypothetical protein [Spiroplasma tabanidicola]|uniref:Uncharacterized protein n=1 Tax=Spiroplasma tabanidicola TaxID=324079 RepID=A0A6I6C7V3_9MOLU|nr:hypothetical protein [Spiroplasma tabanidicola]QGS51846.1 hypothetical protein STABA_v1c04830 [Spiroplasma tabanidicola]
MVITILPTFSMLLFIKYADALKKEGFDDNDRYEYYINNKLNKNSFIGGRTCSVIVFMIMTIGLVVWFFCFNNSTNDTKLMAIKYCVTGFFVFLNLVTTAGLGATFLSNSKIYLNEEKSW